MDYTRITLRLPTDIAAWLKLEAEKNHRSLNGEIIAKVENEKLRQEELKT